MESGVDERIPVGAHTGTVTVIQTEGGLNSSVSFHIMPTESSFKPTSGAAKTSVTIVGTGLTQTTKVTFDGREATSFTVNSDSQITAKVPTGAKTGKIAITTKGGSVTTSNSFTVK